MRSIAGGVHILRSPGSDEFGVADRSSISDSPPAISFAQRRLWFLDHLVGGRPVYSLGRAFRLRGPLILSALQQSVDHIARRHETLRTTFPSVDGEPTPNVSPTGGLPLRFLDLSDLGSEGTSAAMHRLSEEEICRPFDLARGPLIRARLIRLTNEDHVLVVAMHHIVSDAWSIRIFLNELEVLYNAFATGSAPALPELPLQYTDYAIWQRKWLSGDTLRAQLAYWREKLNGAPQALGLRTDHPRPSSPTFAGFRYDFTLPQATIDALKALGRREGATLFMTMLAAWKTLLFRYTGQTDIVVGCPIANRLHPDVEKLIGFFVNLLVVRTPLAGELTFRELLARVRDVALEAYDHQDLPFDKLVEELRPDRDPARHPFVQTAFDLVHEPLWCLRLSGLQVSALDLQTNTARFDLSVEIYDFPGRTGGSIAYSSELFDEKTVARFAAHLRAVLEEVARLPDQPLSELTLLDSAEVRQMMEWNNTAMPYPKDCTVHELVEDQVRRRPHGIAVVCGNQLLTYQELNSRADRLAGHLRKLGVGPEVIVPVCAERSLEMVIGWLGVLKAGGAFLPLDPEYPTERLAFILDDIEAEVVLMQEHLRPRLPTRPMTTFVLDNEASWDSGQLANLKPGRARRQNLAYVIYTSGSTGRPKGVMVTHENLVNLITWHNHYYRVTPRDRASHIAGLGFDAAIWELWPYLCAGASVHLAEGHLRRSPDDLLTWMSSAGISIAFLPTPVAEVVLRSARSPVGSLRAVLTGGDRLASRPPRSTKFELFNNYGPAENTVCATAGKVLPAELNLRPPPIGRPIGNVEAYILDSSLHAMPIGVVGELYIGGAGVARGYAMRPGLTAERFVPSLHGPAGARLYRTGDLARYLSNGEIEFVGRADDQVKIRGARIEPGEVTAVLSRSPAVREVTVLPRKTRDGATRLVAYVVPAVPDASSVTLRQFLLDRLPEPMIPSAFVLLNSLPLTPNGKVDRNALDALEDHQPERLTAYAPPRTALDDMLAMIWAEVLHVERVGIHDNFFEMGGDSMLAVKVAAIARRTYRLSIAVFDLLRYQTIAELSAVVHDHVAEGSEDRPEVEDLVPAGDTARLPLGVEDAYPTSMLQAGMFFHSAYSSSGTAYHQSFSYVIERAGDRPALDRALSLLVLEHPILRTSFDFEHFSEPLQLVSARATVPVEFIVRPDGEHWMPEMRWQAWLRKQLQHPLVWTEAPLMRIAMEQLGANQFQLHVLFHHALLDAWSFDLFLSKLLDYYRRCVKGETIPAPDPNRSFREFIRLERASVRSAVVQEFWRTYLDGAPSGRLPGVKGPSTTPPARTAAVTPSGRLHRRVSDETMAAMRALASELRVSLKSVLLAAHARVVGALVGGDEITTGVVVHGRPESEDALHGVGLFLNTLPVRIAISGTSQDLILRLHAAEAEYVEHGRLPLAFMQRKLGGPSIETLFAFVRTSLDAELHTKVKAVGAYGEISLPLSATFVEERTSGALELQLTYHTSRFSFEEADRIAARYLAAVHELVKAAGEGGDDA